MENRNTSADRAPAAAPLAVLAEDIRSHGVEVGDAAWRAFRGEVAEVAFRAKDVIFRQSSIANQMLFISSGLAASEQLSVDGECSIARFFEPGHFCANLTSVWRKEIASDDLIAITDVEGVLISDVLFARHYFGEGAISAYLRKKVIETLLLDKDIICAKTSIDTEMRYQFLEKCFSSVTRAAPQKDIARFLGITPQGLSRFLKKRRGET